MRAGTSQEVILFVSKIRRQSAGGQTPIYRGKNGACTRCLHAKTNGLTPRAPRSATSTTRPFAYKFEMFARRRGADRNLGRIPSRVSLLLCSRASRDPDAFKDTTGQTDDLR